MADIAMCQHATCPKRHTCYRQTAKADARCQTYGLFKPDAKGNCEHYWPNHARGMMSIGGNELDAEREPGSDG